MPNEVNGPESVWTDMRAPTGPAGFSGAAESTSSIRWNNVAGETAYELHDAAHAHQEPRSGQRIRPRVAGMPVLPELLGNCPAVLAVGQEVGRLLQRQAGGRALPPILIQGETGTGKGLLAAAIHQAGPRRDGPFVAVNCAAIPDTLLEAELFGFERGAFTDARQAKPGLVQTAHRGSLFLDEIGLLPEPLQGKLLTVLEERAVRRLGRTRSEPVDIAILAASTDDLQRAVRERRFSDALYHRLSVLMLRLPPLRERGDDILLLAEHFLARAAVDYGVPRKALTPEATAALLAYSWPGNIRELSNRMERVTLLAESGLVTPEMLGLAEASPVKLREAAAPQEAGRLRDRMGSVERDSLMEALTATGWNLTRAAARLGMPPTTLRYRLKKHGLGSEPPPRGSPGDLGKPASTPVSEPQSDAVLTTAPSAGTSRDRPGNLPVPATPLIGREQDSKALQGQILRADVRLLTLTGPAGVGKTQLALHVAAMVADHFENGVFLVPVANLNDPGLVISAIAQAVGIRETRGRPLVDTLQEHCRDRQLLLVLDRFDQGLVAVPAIAELLAVAPRLKVLATSRAELHLEGEHHFLIAPVTVPNVQSPPYVGRPPAPEECSDSGFANPTCVAYCSQSGTRLKNRCPNCGFENPRGARFCRRCPTSLTRTTLAPGPLQAAPQFTHEQEDARYSGRPSDRRVTREAERRQLTVMFCGLLGSTPVSGQLDPEDLHGAVRRAHEICAETIGRFEGHIAQHLNDGLLVYFGYPRAHEDDAQRAVRTGLSIRQEMRRLNADLERERGVRLAVRVGIHTGVVVIGEMGEGQNPEQLALGDSPQIAAELVAVGESDTVLVASTTYRLIEGYFECQMLGSDFAKGRSRPMAVYQVLRESEAQNRLEAAVSKGLTPLVDREQEIGLLLARWEQAKEGLGQVVLLSGEAGIGKSRLVHALKERIAGESHTRLAFRCSPYYENSALYPIIEHLQRRLRFTREDSPQDKLSKLEEALRAYGFPLEEALSLFVPLLSLGRPEHNTVLAMTPQRQKQKTQEALCAWLLRDADKQVTLAVWEDLQWVDPSTLEFLNLLIDQIPTVRMFILLTFRPDFIPPITTRSHLTQISLNRLSSRQVEAMVEGVARGKAVPSEVLTQLVAKADGVPLFVEELTKAVLESGLVQEKPGHYELTGSRSSLAIPSTLHDSLIARLDGLGTGKHLAQLGAMLGREFSYELIRTISAVDDVTLDLELGRLVDAELLYQRGFPPLAKYVFKHALIQDAAYESLLKGQRQQYHAQIAGVLDERFPDIRDTHPELLAHHYAEGGLRNKAILYLEQASKRAMERSANVEAIGHLTKGLGLLWTLPDTHERAQQELMLQLALGRTLLMTKGPAAPEVEQAYSRAHKLCQEVGEGRECFAARVGLWRFYLNRPMFHAARDSGEEGIALAQRLQDQTLLQDAHVMLGSTLLYQGELDPARLHLEQGIALYDSRQRRSVALSAITDPGVTCLGWAGWTLWFLGYPDRARTAIRRAVTLARELAHPYSLGFALYFSCVLHTLRREVHLAEEATEALIGLAGKQGFVRWAAAAMVERGWLSVQQGAVDQGIQQLCRGLAEWRAMRGELGLTYILARLAEAYGRAGRIEEGLQALAEAIAIGQRNAERHYEAELYRLRGECLLLRTVSDAQQAEASFHQALDVARQQQAKSLELRAALSLCRLWQRQGRHAEARELLAGIYDWFTEGFDTPDLQEAKSLLEA